MSFTNSQLAKVIILSPNHSGQRKHEIDTITIHCVVGQCSARRIGEIFLPESVQASSNYGIGYDGEIGLYVEEKNRSWCSSSSSNDNRAITIEVASDTKEPYAVTDKAYAALIDLVTDICKRNNIKELKWKGDKSLVGQVDKQNMTVHRWFANKSCPGTYLYDRHGQIASEVNARLGVKPPTDTTPVVTFNIGDVVNIKNGVTTYSDGTKMASWVPKSTLYVRGFNTDNRVIISTLKEGAITGTVFASDIILVESITKPEDKPDEAKPAAKLPGIASAGSKEDEKKLWNFLLDKIGNEYGVAGLMGNLYAESELKSNNLQNTYESILGYTDDSYTAAVDSGIYTNFTKDSAGYGLAQWTFWSRKQALLEYAQLAGKSICDFETQMEFLWKELSCDFKSILNVLKTSQSVTEASTCVLINFESPADQCEIMQAKRASYGQKYYDAYHVIAQEPPSEETKSEDPREEQKEEKDENINEDVNLPAEDGVIEPSVDVSTGEDTKKTETNDAPKHNEAPKKSQSFIAKLLNGIIDFIARLFKK